MVGEPDGADLDQRVTRGFFVLCLEVGMSLLVIKPVESKRDKKQFLQLPWELYRNDPNWVPPLRTNQAELVGFKKHPFYDRAEVQTFLAIRDGKACGRVA